jgi:hypothetical protein
MTEPIYSPQLTRRHTVAGLFPDRTSAEQAINELKAAGFTGNQIGVAMRDRTAQGELIAETDVQAAASAVTGAVGGGLLGGLAGFLIGIGAVAIPGIGPVIAGGARASVLPPEDCSAPWKGWASRNRQHLISKRVSGVGRCSSPWTVARASSRPWPSSTVMAQIPDQQRAPERLDAEDPETAHRRRPHNPGLTDIIAGLCAVARRYCGTCIYDNIGGARLSIWSYAQAVSVIVVMFPFRPSCRNKGDFSTPATSCVGTSVLTQGRSRRRSLPGICYTLIVSKTYTARGSSLRKPL